MEAKNTSFFNGKTTVRNSEDVDGIAGDTMVLTKSGLVRIGEILSEGVGGIFAFETPANPGILIAVRSQGTTPTLRVKLSHGFELVGAPDHALVQKFRGGRPVTKKLENLVPYEDYVLLPLGQNSWADGTGLNIDDAYLLGLLVSEGYFGDGPNDLVITNTELQIHQFLSSLSWRQAKDKIHWSVYGEEARRLSGFFRGKPKSKDQIIPDIILRSQRTRVVAFLQGLYDGDGCATTRNRIVLSTTSKRLAQDVQLVLLNMGILASVRMFRHKNPKHNDGYHVETTGYWSEKFFHEIGFRLPRKQSWVSHLKVVRRKPKKTGFRVPIGDTDLTWRPKKWKLSRLHNTYAVPVIAVERAEEQHVYVLRGDRGATFVANGILNGFGG